MQLTHANSEVTTLWQDRNVCIIIIIINIIINTDQRAAQHSVACCHVSCL